MSIVVRQCRKFRAGHDTDPACPWSWANEPALRRLGVEFGGDVPFTYLIGGSAGGLTLTSPRPSPA